MYATGASPTAARLAGIRTNRNIFIAFLMSSVLAGVSGLILLSQVGGASVVADTGPRARGRHRRRARRDEPVGRPRRHPGHDLAVLIRGRLGNGLVQLRIQPFWIEVANGALLLAAVGFDQARIRFSRTTA